MAMEEGSLWAHGLRGYSPSWWGRHDIGITLVMGGRSWQCGFLRFQSQKQSLEQEAGLSGLIFKGLPPSDCFLQLSPTP